MKDSVYPFRVGRIDPVSDKRIEKCRNEGVQNQSRNTALLNCFTSPRGFWSCWSFFCTAGTKFLFPQFFVKFGLWKIPVKPVDNKLDFCVPFRPSMFSVYSDFINYWIRPLSLVMKRFGRKNGLRIAIEFLRYVDAAYHEAYKVYKVSMTTTHRPVCTDRRVNAMRAADPHYMCVPSLHIAVICLTIGFFNMLFEREDFTEEEKNRWYAEIYDHGIAIAESVLYMKQHSVNCLPAAIYMITRCYPEIFTPELGIQIIQSLFQKRDDISVDEREEIVSYIKKMYEDFLLEGIQSSDWDTVVLRWLSNYTSYTYTPDEVKYLN